MSGARRMQELKYFRDGATLVVSLDGLNWLSKRRCDEKRVKKRNEEFQLLITSGQMIRADEELQTIIFDHRGGVAPQLWRKSDCRSRPPLSTSPRHCCHPEEPTHPSELTSFVSERPKEAPWTRLILNMQDISTNRLIIFCDEDIPLPRFSDVCYTEDCRMSVVDNDNNVISDFKNSTAHSPSDKNSNRNELVIRDNFNNNKSPWKSLEIYDAPGVLSGRDDNVKRRKSVSFDDDVLVYLFDQESPTVELHSEACPALPEDSGLEWEDDFSALEKNCHFQCPTHSSIALSRRFSLSQTCLFLTHVTESDLELQPALAEWKK